MSLANVTVSAWARRLAAVFLIALMAAPISACGRKGSPEHPEGSKYPREYPKE